MPITVCKCGWDDVHCICNIPTLNQYIMKYNSKPYQLPDYPDTDTEVIEEEGIEQQELLNLIVWNDDVNTFDDVIQTLIKICGHEEIQAIQSAHIIHNNGKCSVKQGSYKKLKPMLEAILDRKISATIE